MSEQSGGLEGRVGIEWLRGFGVACATSIRAIWQECPWHPGEHRKGCRFCARDRAACEEVSHG